MQSHAAGEEGEMELVWTTYVRIRIEGNAKAGDRQRFKVDRVKGGVMDRCQDPNKYLPCLEKRGGRYCDTSYRLCGRRMA